MYDIAIFGPSADKLEAAGCRDFTQLATDTKKEMRKLVDYCLAWGLDNRQKLAVATTGIAGFEHLAFWGIEAQKKRLEKQFIELENRLYLPCNGQGTTVPGSSLFSEENLQKIKEAAYWWKEMAKNPSPFWHIRQLFKENTVRIVYHLMPEDGEPDSIDRLIIQESADLGDRFYIMKYYCVKDGRAVISKGWPPKP